jgi:hypothetical protein
MIVRHPLGVTVGNTHASSVIVVVRSSELAWRHDLGRA